MQHSPPQRALFVDERLIRAERLARREPVAQDDWTNIDEPSLAHSARRHRRIFERRSQATEQLAFRPGTGAQSRVQNSGGFRKPPAQPLASIRTPRADFAPPL